MVLIVAVGLLVFRAPARPSWPRPGRNPVLRQLAIPAAARVARISTTIGKPPTSLHSPCAHRVIMIRQRPIRCSSSSRRQDTIGVSPRLFYDLTTEATRRGFIVAYSDHKVCRPRPSRNRRRWLRPSRAFSVSMKRRSLISVIPMAAPWPRVSPLTPPKASATPHSIVASAAGITSEDLGSMACPSIPAVLIVHSRADERFPDFGRGTASSASSAMARSAARGRARPRLRHARARQRPARAGARHGLDAGRNRTGARRGRLCRVPGDRDARNREPDERRGFRGDEAERASSSMHRAGTWSTRRPCCRRSTAHASPVPRSTWAARPTRCRRPSWRATRA